MLTDKKVARLRVVAEAGRPCYWPSAASFHESGYHWGVAHLAAEADPTTLIAVLDRNAQLEANLLDYWAAHGAAKHVEEPRVVKELRAKVAELEAFKLDVARTVGIYHGADGHGDQPGPDERVLEEVRGLVALAGDRERLRTDLEAALRKQVFVVGVDDSPRVVALEARVAELEAENAALCRANTEERARRKAAEADRDAAILARKESRTKLLAELARAVDDQRRIESLAAERDAALKRVAELERQDVDDAAAHDSMYTHLECERDAARATVERVRASVALLKRRLELGAGPVPREAMITSLGGIEAVLTPPGDGGVR